MKRRRITRGAKAAKRARQERLDRIGVEAFAGLAVAAGFKVTVHGPDIDLDAVLARAYECAGPRDGEPLLAFQERCIARAKGAP